MDHKTGAPTSQHQELILDEKPDSISSEAYGGESVEDLPDNYFWSYKFIGSFVALALAYQSNFLGFTMIANVLTVIDADLGPSNQSIWILLSYILAESVTFTVIGQLTDIFGRRWYYIVGTVLSLVGAIICARATSVNMVIGGMVPSGIGGGIQAAAAIASGELVPNKHRFIALGAIFMLLSPVSSIGPGLARTFVAHTSASWRWCYYVLIILSMVSLILLVFCYFPPTFKQLHQGRTKRQVIKSLDYGGIVLFSGSLASILLGVSWGGQKYPWKSGNVIGTIVGGGVGMGLFFIYENFAGVKTPLIPMHLLKNMNYVTLMICSAMGVSVFYALSIVWPQQIVALFDRTGTTVGWMSCTLTAGAVSGQGIGAVVTHFVPGLKYQLIISCIVFTVFISAMAAIDSSRETMAIVFSLIGGLAIGYMEVITVAGGILMVAAEDVGVAIGIQYAVRLGLTSLSTSIYATILINEVTKNLPAYVIPAAMKSGLNQAAAIQLLGGLSTGNITLIQSVPGITPSIIEVATVAVKSAYQKSFRTVYLASIAFGVVAVITAVAVNKKKLNDAMTPEIARKLQGVGKARNSDEEKIASP